MHGRRLPLVALRVATRHHQLVFFAHSRSRITPSFVRARALATASSSPSPSPSPSSPPPPAPAPTTSGAAAGTPPPSSDPALHKIVDDISVLTLLQAADLVTLLKTRLNIQEIALPAAGAVGPAAGGAAGADDAEGADEAAAAAAKPKEKTIFNVKLESFDAGSKPKVIKEVKALVPNLTLIEAKKFVESVPKVLKEGIPKEDAEKIKKAFEAHGAVVLLE